MKTHASRRSGHTLPRTIRALALIGATVLAITACGDGDTKLVGSTTQDDPDTKLQFDATPAVVASGSIKDPTVAVSPIDGRIYVAWGQDVEIDHSKHDDTTHAAHTKAGGQDATPAGGRAPEPSQDVLLASSSDGGTTWSTPVRVNDVPGEARVHSGGPPQVAVSGSGRVFVTWGKKTDWPGQDHGRNYVRLASSINDGASFTPAVDVMAGEGLTSASFHNVLIDDEDRVWVSMLDYRENFRKDGSGQVGVRLVSTKNGTTFTRSVRAGIDSCQCCRTAMASHGDALVVGWRQLFDAQDPVDWGDRIRDIAVATTTDDGRTWSKPVKVHDDGWRINQCPHSGSSLDYDADGVLHTAWFTGAKGSLGYYHATSTDDGATWSTPTPFMMDEWAPPGAIRLTVDDDTTAWIVWEDLRTDDSGVGLARVTDGTGAGAVVAERIADGKQAAIADIDGGGAVAVWVDETKLRVGTIGADR